MNISLSEKGHFEKYVKITLLWIETRFVRILRKAKFFQRER